MTRLVDSYVKLPESINYALKDPSYASEDMLGLITMDISILRETVNRILKDNKGILAADESTKSIEKRFAAIGVESNPENNRRYRQLLFTAPEIEKYIGGVILFDETIRQSTDDGTPFPKLLEDRGIVPGIKVDKGTVELAGFPGEKTTEGLDGLRERLKEYYGLGARFTKWRAVITIGEGIPTDACIKSNACKLAEFAAISQEANMVPIVEPEVLMDGNHSLKRCSEVTYSVLKSVFIGLNDYKVDLSGIFLKPNLILPGKESSEGKNAPEIAKATISCFREVVPDEVPGIVFLSGGLSPEDSTLFLNEINKAENLSWQLSFSFGRALQEPVLKAWEGKDENIGKAQEVFLKRAKLNSLARSGNYSPEMENN